ncbi:arylsulfatase [Nocardioides cavernae]|uniref:Arylsulfatase n=1 Tax=Nocardioides cavernae TaxID=1921566 RepID=A0ABR8NC32_9ACTN|nr:arylsulfatase [Nocardioides cavernae]MBD3925683.1 arylsulfatase [Nocardioides cavernae]MBM7513267.1 arylsulfatase [Nocardioides cavernae]
MAKPFKGVVNLDITKSTPDWEPFAQPVAPDGSPNVLYIVLDDVGFSAMQPYGGLIETPNINRIAERGLTYTNFHTTALCSPTRSSLLTGRNHTTNSMASITEAAAGFPNSSGHIPFECGNIAEVLGERGWNTYMVGKWHLCPEDEMNLASTRRQWPLGRGFERFYGFLGAETNQWYPDLVHDNHPVDQPASPEEGYHFGTDITDRALAFIRDAKAVAPDKPFLLYYCPGACHAPHHAPQEWSDRYRGKFDMGYEMYREQVFQRQKTLGILPEHAELSPINPYVDQTSKDGKTWPELDTVRPWESLTDDEKRLFARMAEVYAGFLSHADHEIGRLLDYLEQSGQLDNTLIVLVSDNGASGEGGPNGSVNENKLFNGLPDKIEENLDHLDVLGTPLTYNHYPTGWAWAFNTPFKMWKRYANYEGGTADPMIVSWPERITEHGVRTQYTHAVDIVPTVYEAFGIEVPETLKGYTQFPVEGVSFVASFDDPAAKTGKQTQFYSMGGTRAIWNDGWKAAALSPAAPDCWADYPSQQWELFNTDLDPTECHDVADEHPDKLRELIDLWWIQAGMYNALPLENRGAVEILTTERPQIAKPRNRYVYYPGCAEVPESVAPNTRNRSYTVAVEADIETDEASGVLFSHGARFGGHALYVKDGRLKYVYNWVGMFEQIVESDVPITTGPAVFSASFERDGDTMPAEGTLTLHIGDTKVGEGRIRTQPGRFSIAGEGLNIGRDSGEPITDDYPGQSPWTFVGGTIHKAVVDVSGAPFVDLAQEAAMAFARD